MHATELARRLPPLDKTCLVVLHGPEWHLKQAALSILCRQALDEPMEEALGLVRLPGKDLEFKAARDELLQGSMFSSRKLVLIEDADDFISRWRAPLENYAEKPGRQSLLVLEVKSWRKNTRLAKKVDADGLAIDCSELQGAALQQWLIRRMKDEYDRQLAPAAAEVLVQLAGGAMSLLDQELAKLAASAEEGQSVGEEDVRRLVGGWKSETTWTMTDAIRDGRAGVALRCLANLLYAGEPAPKILGGINFVFRKFAIALERSRGGEPLRSALQKAGVFPRDIGAGEQYLKRLGRPRAERILEVLAQADYGLKGGSRLPESLQLEQLILSLAGSIPATGT